MKSFYLGAAIFGTLVPWAFFTSFAMQNGMDIPLFIRSLFANGASGGFTADLLITSGIFWVWSWQDAREHDVPGWWLTIPAIWTVGLSLGLPLYLFLRERSKTA